MMTKRFYRLLTVTFFGSFLVCLIAIRFSLLEFSPPGFYVDEAGSVAHILCLKETGKNCNGDSFTLYSTTWGVGRIGPMHQYAGWLWTEIFGGTISALRSLSATFGLAALLILCLFVSSFAGRRVAFCTALSGLLLPWSFHSSRIAWDPPLAPVFVVLLVFCVYKAARMERWIIYAIGGALSANLAGLAYAPVYAHVAFLLVLLFLLQRFLFPMPFLRWLTIGVVSLIIFSGVRMADTSAVEGRASEIAIWGNDPRNPTADKPWTSKVLQFVENTGKHFDPEYLFTTGEFNLRHTASNFGIFSWLDLFSLLAAAALFLLARVFPTLQLRSDQKERYQTLLLLGIIGYLTAAMAASITWDSIPHGLRSLSGWPFAVLFAGVSLSYISRFRVLTGGAIVVALLFIHAFSVHYFNGFRQDAAWWFDSDVYDAFAAYKQTGDQKKFREFLATRQYPNLARKYYFIEYLKEAP